MFKFIKECTNLIKQTFSVKKAIEDQIEMNKTYLTMSIEELKQLSDEQLYEAVFARTGDKVDKYKDMMEGVNSLTKPQQVFYITSYYEMEVNNGGLCQFFVNSSRYVAPMLSECLAEVGAIEQKELYDSFVNDNNIELHNLDLFIIDDVKEYETNYKRYPFDEFDDDFYTLQPIEDYIIGYMKKNIGDF